MYENIAKKKCLQFIFENGSKYFLLLFKYRYLNLTRKRVMKTKFKSDKIKKTDKLTLKLLKVNKLNISQLIPGGTR